MVVDPTIQKKANDIRIKTYGLEVRESLASGLEAMSEDVVSSKKISDEATAYGKQTRSLVQPILDESFDNAALTTHFEGLLEDELGSIQPEWTVFHQSVKDNSNDVSSLFIKRLSAGLVEKIKLIGDSISAGAGCGGYYEPKTRQIFDRTGYGMQYETGTDWNLFPSWANLFRKYINTEYPSIDFFNAGIGGLQTKEVRDSYLDDLIDDNEDVVFVMLGTNDRSLTTLAEYRENIEYVLDYINQRSKVMIVMTATPSLSDFADTTYTNYAEARNFGAREIDNVLTTLCSEKGYTHISHYRGLLDYAAKTNTKLEDLLQPVGSHPVTKGYAVMWQTIQQRLGFANDVKEWFDGKRDVIHTESYNAVNVNTPITYFQSKSVSYHLIATSAVIGFPSNKAGTLETFRPSVESLDLWGYQLYHIYGTGELWYRQWKGGSWTAFETYKKASATDMTNLDYLSSTTASRSIVDYPANTLSKLPLRDSNADLANFPEGKGGLLITDRQLLNYENFSYQEYHVYQTSNIYRRYWTGSAWAKWKRISANLTGTTGYLDLLKSSPGVNEGDTAYNTSLSKVVFFNGVNWV